MTQNHVILRQISLAGVAALPARGRIDDPAPAAAIERSRMEAQEEGLRQGREQGLRAGHEEGLREGRAAALAEATALAASVEADAGARRAEQRAALDCAMAALQEAAMQWVALAEEDMVTLCFETIARILGRRAAATQSVRAQVTELLAHWNGLGVPTLHLHPADVQFLDDMAGPRPFNCIADPEVRYGGCMVRGENGTLDARLDCILEEVKSALLAARDERQVPGDAP